MENDAPEDDYGVPGDRSMAAAGSPSWRSAVDGGEQLIRWERFLPKRSLRVLLVEHDDSTRHIVAALLRKCSYHVLAVDDGRKAWEVMKEKSYNFDLVLTEFEMPLLSGIVLLSKIVGTEGCKNIPVIMMSSQDSVGIVHKCMLKGAADFLVKPLRKNELRNLWQHVWRRHCSSSYACASENSTASNQFSSNAGERSQSGENSDKGSDAQSLKSKPDAELEMFQKQTEVLAKHGQSPRDAEAHPEQPGKNMTKNVGTSVMEDNGVLRDKTLVEDFTFLPIQLTPLTENNGHTSHLEDDFDSLRYVKGGNEQSNLPRQINSHTTMKPAITEGNLSSGAAICSQMNHVSNSSVLPLWELSLRTQLNGSVEHHVKKQNILNHSNASAFTRYAGNRNKECVDQLQSHVSCHGNVNMNCSLFTSRDEGVIKVQMFSDESMEDVTLASGAHVGEDTSCKELISFQNSLPVGAVPYQGFYTGYEAQLQPNKYQDNTSIAQSLDATDDGTSKLYSDHFSRHSGSTELRCHDFYPLPSRVQVNDTKNGEQKVLSCCYREEAHGSSLSKNLLKASGSNCSGEIADAAGVTGIAVESGIENDIQNRNKKLPKSYSSYRETALIKFRLKRKDRCFKKKVRYHNRQKLAEQRPRVKGQFVREKIFETNTAREVDG